MLLSKYEFKSNSEFWAVKIQDIALEMNNYKPQIAVCVSGVSSQLMRIVLRVEMKLIESLEMKTI